MQNAQKMQYVVIINVNTVKIRYLVQLTVTVGGVQMHEKNVEMEKLMKEKTVMMGTRRGTGTTPVRVVCFIVTQELSQMLPDTECDLIYLS